MLGMGHLQRRRWARGAEAWKLAEARKPAQSFAKTQRQRWRERKGAGAITGEDRTEGGEV